MLSDYLIKGFIYMVNNALITVHKYSVLVV